MTTAIICCWFRGNFKGRRIYFTFLVAYLRFFTYFSYSSIMFIRYDFTCATAKVKSSLISRSISLASVRKYSLIVLEWPFIFKNWLFVRRTVSSNFYITPLNLSNFLKAWICKLSSSSSYFNLRRVLYECFFYLIGAGP